MGIGESLCIVIGGTLGSLFAKGLTLVLGKLLAPLVPLLIVGALGMLISGTEK
ncbi:hypothetical protein [uncultured Selenomonas sp.]|uniref:hypothetical protein n=1 Tax=uncultured Selenomonas sp. TaxID=159275 RepID=UPI0025CEC56A|nr:hypothetical protein [uncultured Selenomonas sp.]